MNTTFTIIGGGASGTLLFIQLVKQAVSPLSIVLVNSGYPLSKGIAYSTTSDTHLLNVRASRMSAFPDEPLHFVNWIQKKSDYSSWHHPDLGERFVPRKMYGHYLEELLSATLKNIPGHIKTKQLNDTVVNIEKNGNGYKVFPETNSPFESSKIILCTGNLTPVALPGGINSENVSHVCIDPWDVNNTKNISNEFPLLIIGSGLTMADTVLSLIENKFKNKMYVLSRHGQIPVSHPLYRDTHHGIPAFNPGNELTKITWQVNEQIRHAKDEITWHEPVLDAIRPHTQKLWQQFSIQEKEQFLRHLNHRWSRLRHRLPSEIFLLLMSKISTGQLELISGNLKSINEKYNKLEVIYHDRKNQTEHNLQVQRVINCTGPEANILKSKNPLIRNLLANGMIRPDSMKLGYDALPDGQLIDRSGKIVNTMFTLGPGMRGILWECTAIPEIRVHAKELAARLIQD